jgi:aminomethyltransferase
LTAPSTTHPQRTALHGEHIRAGAVMVDFHGWEMPIRYGSIPEEHQKVRLSAGIFDLGHMGRLEVSGPGAEEWLQRLITNDLAAIPPGDARYTLITNERGTIIDDAIVYRLPGSLLLVVNASNRPRVIEWMEAHREGAQAKLIDRTADWAMVAVQGPQAARIIPPLFEQPQREWEALRYYQILSASFDGRPVWVARTGYTGEDGFEVYLPAESAETLWRQLLDLGGNRIAPVGLGARDTLRLEAGMPLYGNDIDESTNPFEARLGFAVKLDKKIPFIGQEALRALHKEKPRRLLRGFRVEGRRIARQGMKVYRGEREVGIITSGAPSPTLGHPIAMGYLASGAEEGDEPLAVDLRGRREALALEPLPFYSRTRKRVL